MPVKDTSAYSAAQRRRWAAATPEERRAHSQLMVSRRLELLRLGHAMEDAMRNAQQEEGSS